MNCRSNQPVQVGYRIMDFHYLAKTVASCFLYESRERSAITIPIIQFYGEMERDDQKGIRTAEQWVRLMYSELPAPKAAGADTATATEAPPAPATAPAAEKPTEEAVEEGLVPVKANVTSVFYRRPSPDEPPFVATNAARAPGCKSDLRQLAESISRVYPVIGESAIYG
jgi:hypothetical protein